MTGSETDRDGDERRVVRSRANSARHRAVALDGVNTARNAVDEACHAPRREQCSNHRLLPLILIWTMNRRVLYNARKIA